MTEYDFSPEAYEQYIRGQQRIRRWVHQTNETPKADPYQAATPAIDVPREILPPSRIWDTNPPWSAQSDEKKKPRKHRTPSEKEFDRERRNDWKYSHREHMDTLRTATARTKVPRVRRLSYDSTIPRPPPLQSRSLHPRSRFPADHRFSDSQNTSSSSEYVHVSPPHTTRKRSSSVQAPIRVPLPGPLPGPMPLPGLKLHYVYGPEINAQVVLDEKPSEKGYYHSSTRRNKPTRSQTVPRLSPPPASAPVYPSQQNQGHHQYHSSSSPVLHRPQQVPQQQPRPVAAYPYPYPYAPSPLSPPNTAPAYPYPRSPGGFMPEPPKLPGQRPKPFLKRMFLNFASQKKANFTNEDSEDKTTNKTGDLGSLSQPSTPSPTSPMKSKTWLGSPVKNKLIKTHRKEPSETMPRSNSSLDRWPGSGGGEPGIGGVERGWFKGPQDAGKERERAKEREKERERETARTREEKRRDEKGRMESRAGQRYGENDRKKERSDREKDRERERHKNRRRDRSRSGSRERHKDRKDREHHDRHRGRHQHRERSRSYERDQAHELDRERGKDNERERGRDRTPRHRKPKEKTARG
ncbi:hypothetical protein H2248_000030 [Termitomyces sp. 'cryptogamus']|nr:hypothetical protein H2248_000030 [Termitomyces sp. 'cryptogamus']